MTKTEHLQFLVLMIPTFLILVAAAVSMADLALPAADHHVVAAIHPTPDLSWDDRQAQ
jgi:hypothetical protein